VFPFALAFSFPGKTLSLEEATGCKIIYKKNHPLVSYGVLGLIY
jgi:hypothetical protein